jgi:glycine/D-amino acid oxidase-like deaminating enzyme
MPGRAAKQDHVVIAGAGIIGASIAFHLARRGARVTVLEKQRPGAGATEKSFAWINANPAKQPRSYYELNLLGIAGWRRLCIESGADFQVQWGGSVKWFPSGAEADKLRKDVTRHEQWGYATHLIEPAGIAHLLPAVSPGPVGAASFSEQEGTVDPLQALGAYLKVARQAGAIIEYPCEVTGISRSDRQVRAVETTRGRIEADFLVLAAGVDTPRLARMAEVNVPLQESTGVLAHTAPCPRLLERIALAPGADIKQNPDGRIVTGLDFGDSGLREAAAGHGLKLLHNAERFVPELKGAKLETVTLGHRVLPKDGHPIIGFAERCPNLYIAAMHSGITLSPLVGQLAAAEILDGMTVDLLAPYRPARFA